MKPNTSIRLIEYFKKNKHHFFKISEICEEPGEEVDVDHLVAIEQKSVGLYVYTQPSEAAGKMFEGSGDEYRVANGDVKVTKHCYTCKLNYIKYNVHRLSVQNTIIVEEAIALQKKI